MERNEANEFLTRAGSVGGLQPRNGMGLSAMDHWRRNRRRREGRDPEKDRAQCAETKTAARGTRRLGRAELGRGRRRPGHRENGIRDLHGEISSRAREVEEEDDGKFLTARGQHGHCTRTKHH
jgi:hypothetical protein